MAEPTTTVSENFPLTQIYFYLTDGCNLRCRHCWISPIYSDDGSTCKFLSFDLFKKIVREAKPLGLTMVKLTGGEPLLHPQIGEILDFIKAEGLGLNVETNGVLCTPELVEKMAACKPVHVGVSIDGANAETHEWVRGVDGCFDDAIQGIKNIVNAGIRSQIIMTIMRRNVDELGDVIKLAEELGVYSLKFNIVQPTERGESMVERGETLSIEELVDLGRRVNMEMSKETKVKLIYTQPTAFQPMSKMMSREGGCSVCGIKNIIGVIPDGQYALCGIGERVPEMVFGDAAKDRLEDVWNNSTIICQIRHGLPSKLEGVCGQCVMKKLCLGSCIAQNYYRTKSIWAPYWYCDDALKSGLFPKSRLVE